MSALSTFKELSRTKIAEIKAELEALEESSAEVQRYKLLIADLADWARAIDPATGPQPALKPTSEAKPLWPADLFPLILAEAGRPMSRKELKEAAFSRGVRTPGSSPPSDLDRFLSHSRNYGDLAELDGRIFLPEWAVVKILKEHGRPMTLDGLTDAVLPEHTRASKIRKRYELNFKGKAVKKMVEEGLVILEKGKVRLPD